jgi:hypothetical protein
MRLLIRNFLPPLFLALFFAGGAAASDSPRYLAFQIFTGAWDSNENRLSRPPPPRNLRNAIVDLRERIGGAGTANRHIGFVLGPIAFDNTDEQVRELIESGFNIALETGVAVGLHIDDSMFWGRLKELDTPANIEWLDWKGTPNTGRLLDWSPPIKIMPQLCINSKGVQSAVSLRAALIGKEIAKGIQKLSMVGKDDLFLGVIAGWETEIGRDFDARQHLRYCALTNAGYGERNKPVDIDSALSKIIREFIGLWASSLTNAGVPPGKVYSHIALMSDKSPPAAFCDFCIPGLSTYPLPGVLAAWQRELANHGNPPWASGEGTAMDPREAERGSHGIGMEGYLGNLLNHGAVLVNIFGWGAGDENNPFRKIAESGDAVAAYRKFLRGEKLSEALIPGALAMFPANLQEKIHKVRTALPRWLKEHGSAQVQDDVEKLKQSVEEKRFDDAAAAADAILKTLVK